MKATRINESLWYIGHLVMVKALGHLQSDLISGFVPLGGFHLRQWFSKDHASTK